MICLEEDGGKKGLFKWSNAFLGWDSLTHSVLLAYGGSIKREDAGLV